METCPYDELSGEAPGMTEALTAASPIKKRRKKRYRLNKPFNGLMFLAPGLAGFCVFFIWPFCVSLYYSFLSRPVNGVFIGIKNYTDMFQNVAYLRGLTNTARFIGISVPLNMAASLIIALMIRNLMRHKELFTLIFLIPLVIPSGSTVTFWKTLLAQDGVLNSILHYYDIGRINWLDSGFAFWVIVIIFAWKNLGFNMVLYISGLGNIPVDYYEAARVDGANPVQAFFRFTLPHLAASSVLVLILSIVNSFKVFKEIYLITESYPHESIYTLQHFMNNMFASLNYPKLTTATTILVVMITILTQGLLKLERNASE
jgi:multiple sugar transport system permease protein